MMNKLAGIFFHMCSCNADLFLFSVYFDIKMASFADWKIELRCLEVLRKIRIIIILAVKLAEAGNLAIQGKACTYCKFQYSFIQDRKYAWKP